MQDRMRLSVPPGGAPKLRAVGSSYVKTGFKRPVLSGVRSAGLLPLRVLRTTVATPPNFRWQPQDLTSIMDQGNCGSCWAHAAASVLGDRVSIQTGGAVRTALSVQQIMECSAYLEDAKPTGCDGNEPYICLKSIKERAVPLYAYAQYARDYNAADSDPSKCAESSPKQPPTDRYTVTVDSVFMINEPVKTAGDDANVRNVQNMKNHIYFEGPIIGTFAVYSDFMDYDGKSIYEPSKKVLESGEQPGGHAIELIGWGTDPDSGVGYWVGRNSWGSGWPRSHDKCAGTGTFYFKMGSNTCDIESWCAGAIPVTHAPNLAPKDAGGMYPGESPCSENDFGRSSIVGGSSSNARLIFGLLLLAAVVAGGYLVYRRRAAS